MGTVEVGWERQRRGVLGWGRPRFHQCEFRMEMPEHTKSSQNLARVALSYTAKVTAGVAGLPTGSVLVRSAASELTVANSVGLGRPVAIHPRSLVPVPILVVAASGVPVVRAAPEAELDAPAPLAPDAALLVEGADELDWTADEAVVAVPASVVRGMTVLSCPPVG